jgi:capsular polysaccharide biosynthesis protein
MSSNGAFPPRKSPGEVRRAERLRLREERSAARKEQGGARERSKGLTEDRIKQWRVSRGNLTFFNCTPKQIPTLLIENIPMTAEVLPEAFVSSCERQANDAVGPVVFSGAVYRRDGTIVPEFIEHERLQEESGRKKLLNPQVATPERMARAKTIGEPCVYLGDLKYPYGHFLLETLARAWYLKTSAANPRVIFHHGSEDLAGLGSFGHVIFQALGLDPSRIMVAFEDLRVASLAVPTAQYLNTIKGSPGMCAVFDHIRERILSARRRGGRTPGKVYFTRRRIVESAQANTLPAGINPVPRRPLVNEDEAEAVFSKLGFEVISPETLPFEEQVATVAGATHIAGTAGSALHSVLFNGNPATRLIELRTKPARNQLIIGAIRGMRSSHIWCLNHRMEDRTTKLDIDVIERAMREIA